MADNESLERLKPVVARMINGEYGSKHAVCSRFLRAIKGPERSLRYADIITVLEGVTSMTNDSTLNGGVYWILFALAHLNRTIKVWEPILHVKRCTNGKLAPGGS